MIYCMSCMYYIENVTVHHTRFNYAYKIIIKHKTLYYSVQKLKNY